MLWGGATATAHNANAQIFHVVLVIRSELGWCEVVMRATIENTW